MPWRSRLHLPLPSSPGHSQAQTYTHMLAGKLTLSHSQHPGSNTQPPNKGSADEVKPLLEGGAINTQEIILK